MKQIVKALLVMLSIAMCLTSDTALSASQVQGSRFKVPRSEPLLSASSVGFVGTTPIPRYWECRNWIPQVHTLQSEYLRP